jgi:hypothetical protein
MWDLLLSTAGCFVLSHGYGLVAIGKEGLSVVASDRAAAVPRMQLADVDAVDLAGSVSDCFARHTSCRVEHARI